MQGASEFHESFSALLQEAFIGSTIQRTELEVFEIDMPFGLFANPAFNNLTVKTVRCQQSAASTNLAVGALHQRRGIALAICLHPLEGDLELAPKDPISTHPF